MKVAMITESLGRTGGVDTYVLEVSKHFPNDIDIITKKMFSDTKIRNNVIFYKNYRELVELAKNYDIFHVHYFPLNLYCAIVKRKIRNLKLVHTWHGIVPFQYMDSLKRRIKTMLVYFSHYFAFRYADRIISVSNFIKEELKEEFRRKTIVIPNGVDLKRFKFRKKLGNKILFFGALEKYRGVHFIPIFAKKTPSYEYVLVGRGKLKNYLEHVIKREKLANLKILGYIPFNKIPSLYRNVAITIRPSLYEGFGIPLLESFASGKPVIVSDFPVFREIVSDGKDGFIVPINNFPKYIELLMEDKFLRKKMSRNARKKAKNFRWKDIAKRIFNVYLSLRK